MSLRSNVVNGGATKKSSSLPQASLLTPFDTSQKMEEHELRLGQVKKSRQSSWRPIQDTFL